MRVASGSEWQVGTGKRNYEVALEDHDGEAVVPGWKDLTWPQRYKALQKRADLMVVKYMHEQEVFSDEVLSARVADINGT